MLRTPILFLIFNRPDETQKVFEEVRNVKPLQLFIAADGPRKGREGEDFLCSETRKIVLSKIDWQCEVKTLFREENLGCGKAVSQAINWFFDHVESGIILEDDCLSNASFFCYCEELLERYKYDERIISISGSNFGYQLENGTSYGFARFMNMWGWATWKRSAVLVDYEMKIWRRTYFKFNFLFSKLRASGNIDIRWINYWKNLFNITAAGELDTWDYQWIFEQLKNGKLSIFPAKNLVENIGFSANGTHTKEENTIIQEIRREELSFPIKINETVTIDFLYEENYIKKIWANHVNQTLIEIFKTRLLYIPFIYKFNKYLKRV